MIKCRLHFGYAKSEGLEILPKVGVGFGDHSRIVDDQIGFQGKWAKGHRHPVVVVGVHIHARIDFFRGLQGKTLAIDGHFCAKFRHFGLQGGQTIGFLDGKRMKSREMAAHTQSQTGHRNGLCNVRGIGKVIRDIFLSALFSFFQGDLIVRKSGGYAKVRVNLAQHTIALQGILFIGRQLDLGSYLTKSGNTVKVAGRTPILFHHKLCVHDLFLGIHFYFVP